MKMRSGKNIWEEGMIWRDDLKKWQIQEMYKVEKGVEGRAKAQHKMRRNWCGWSYLGQACHSAKFQLMPRICMLSGLNMQRKTSILGLVQVLHNRNGNVPPTHWLERSSPLLFCLHGYVLIWVPTVWPSLFVGVALFGLDYFLCLWLICFSSPTFNFINCWSPMTTAKMVICFQWMGEKMVKWMALNHHK